MTSTLLKTFRVLLFPLLCASTAAAEVRWKKPAGEPRRQARFLAPDGARLPTSDGEVLRAERLWGETLGVAGEKNGLAHVRLPDGREVCAPSSWLLPVKSVVEAALLDGPAAEGVSTSRYVLSAAAEGLCRAWPRGGTAPVEVPCGRLSREAADVALAQVLDQADALILQGRGAEAVERLKYLPVGAETSRLAGALEKTKEKADAAAALPAPGGRAADGGAETVKDAKGCAF